MNCKPVLAIVLGLFLFSNCAQMQSVQTTPPEPELTVPVFFDMPFAGSTVSSQQLTLQTQGTGQPFPAQISVTNQKLDGKHGILASALLPLSLLREESFTLRQTAQPLVKTSALQWDDDGQSTLTLREGGREIFSYHYGNITPPQGVPAHRTRSSYFHPIRGLDGESLTQDYPADHLHHRGLYHAWPGIFLDNQRFDMWHIVGIWTRYERTLAQEDGPVFANLILQNGWYTSDRKVMDEVMNVTVWHSDRQGQAIDLQYTWTPLEKIHLGPKDKKGYGGLNYRFPTRQATVVTAPDGPQKTSDLKRYPWVDFSGQFEDAPARSGILFMVHPKNIDPNPGWTLRCEDDYGYIGVSWPGLDGFDFEPGQTYTNRFRLWLHRGDATHFDPQALFAAYAQTPTIRVVNK